MSRTWTNGSGLALNAANLNSLENDVATSVKPWAANTYYPVGRGALDPNGTSIICTTAHTSAADFTSDAANWSTPSAGTAAALAIVFGS